VTAYAWSRLAPRARIAVGVVLAVAIGTAVAVLRPPQPTAGASRGTRAGTTGPAVDNVILISIDSLRADRLSSYGNRNETSPTIDRLAANGARFTHAMSTTSWTLPSHMSLLTGRNVLSHGVITENDGLPDTVPTLAEQLQRAGIATAGVVSVPLLGTQYGFGRGFDHYDDQTIPSSTWFDALKDEPAPKVTELAEAWIRKHRDGRFFLFLHYWDVHYDYIPPEPYDRLFDPDYTGSVTGAGFFQDKAINRNLPQRDIDHLLALYDGEIRWVDDHLKKLVALLSELGIENDTAIIVTADHGDEFFEHGHKGHGRTLYREVTQIPLIVYIPGGATDRVIDTPVSLIDVMPTILEVTGVAAPPGVDGISLRPLIDQKDPEERDTVHAWLCFLKKKTSCQAMQHSPSGTLIHHFQPLRIEFYTPDDPRQQNDVASSKAWPRDEQLARMQQVLDEQWQSYRSAGGGQGGVELDKAALERLRALGYVD
jgi:arylsulfatase A-like enzyme